MTLGEEIQLERDSPDVLVRGGWVNAATRADMSKFAAARAAFLDCLLRDEAVVGDVVEEFDVITGASGLVEAIQSLFSTGRRPRYLTEPTPTDVASRHERLMELSGELFSIVGGEDEPKTRAMINAASSWALSNGFDWPWLVRDLVLWYRDKVMFLAPTGGWFGKVSRPMGEWRFHLVEDPDWPSLVVRHRRGEDLDEYRDRAEATFAEFVRRLDAEWPQGRMPRDEDSIEREVQWFYRHRAKGESKSSIAASSFTSQYEHVPPKERRRLVDGRRKDVRDGIRRAETLLASSGVRFVTGQRPAI